MLTHAFENVQAWGDGLYQAAGQGCKAAPNTMLQCSVILYRIR
jgi:hypothetical protein